MQAYAQEIEPAPDAPETAAQAVNVDPAFVWSKVESWVVGFQKLLPNIVVALVLFALFIALAWGIKRSFRAWARRRHRDDLGDVLGASLQWAVLAAGLMIALTVVIPSLNPRDLVAGLGIGSVAIGFAFKDILQNWLAGLLLLFNRPFKVGDQIVVNSFEGTVQRIETRATVIKTYDGRNVVVPNADVYSTAVTVNTANESLCAYVEIGIGYGDSVDEARRVILAAMKGAKGVEASPAPEVLLWELGASAVVLRARWWTGSLRKDWVQSRASVLEAVKKALDAAGIDIAYDTKVLLFHDQTETTDGDRTRQREGWPKRPGGENPAPARRAGEGERNSRDAA